MATGKFGNEKAILFGSLAERCPADFYRVNCKGSDAPWIVSIDGNFQHWRLLIASKYSIPPYLSFLFYEVPHNERASVKATAVTASTTALCAHNFKAAGSKPMTMAKCDETGLMSLVCRHDCCVALMNMYAGERFEWVLFILEKFLDQFHCYAHELRCQKLFGLTLTKRVGESDGEGTERVWGLINDLVSSRRQSSSPNKQLQLEDRLLYSAEIKRFSLAMILLGRFTKAKKNHQLETARLQLVLDTVITVERKQLGGLPLTNPPGTAEQDDDADQTSETE
ncbi:hypothetical protein BJ508DRAFT_217942 [Ascobolus immersus RN42]|uniref:Uncharacterized protein n=1 Tax=Ascobolus immersus RN42 TaxID=1160509 RepID=A0A3N4HAC5_ASCIM|nr:hypothetical protein BJ508DRAFT_217942 [Ascobolus immersus RN42]